jgi:hypothetical protein
LTVGRVRAFFAVREAQITNLVLNTLSDCGLRVTAWSTVLSSHAKSITIDSSQIVVIDARSALSSIIAIQTITWTTSAEIIIIVRFIRIKALTTVQLTLKIDEMIEFVGHTHPVHRTIRTKIECITHRTTFITLLAYAGLIFEETHWTSF